MADPQDPSTSDGAPGETPRPDDGEWRLSGAASGGGLDDVKAMAAKPNGKLELPRRIKPGSELVRTWKGKTYRVVVRPDGFAYDGETYAGLSEIASLITGTNWNGPRFFGLRSKIPGAADGK